MLRGLFTPVRGTFLNCFVVEYKNAMDQVFCSPFLEKIESKDSFFSLLVLCTQKLSIQ